jgi:hypothetical protein
MRTLLFQSNQLLLGVDNDPDNLAISLDLLQITLDALFAILITPFL